MNTRHLFTVLAAALLTTACGEAPQEEWSVSSHEMSLRHANERIVLSTAMTARVPCAGADCLRANFTVSKGEVFEYWTAAENTDTAQTLLRDQRPYDAADDDAPAFGFHRGANINAIHWEASSVVLSTSGNGSIRDLDVKGGDLVRLRFETDLDGDGAADAPEVEKIFTGIDHFAGAGTKIDAVYGWPNGQDGYCADPDHVCWAMSTLRNAKVGGHETRVLRGDVFLYNQTLRTVETFLVDAESGIFSKKNCKADKGEQVDGFHVLPNGNYLLSVGSTTRMGACDALEKYTDGDVIEYAPAQGETGHALYLSESVFLRGSGAQGANEEVDAISVRPCLDLVCADDEG